MGVLEIPAGVPLYVDLDDKDSASLRLAELVKPISDVSFAPVAREAMALAMDNCPQTE